jgi:hypothetical protein
MKVVRLSALRTGRLYPRRYLWYSFLLEAVNPRAIAWLEGLSKWKIQMTPLGIEPATFRLVAQCLNQLRHHVPITIIIIIIPVDYISQDRWMLPSWSWEVRNSMMMMIIIIIIPIIITTHIWHSVHTSESTDTHTYKTFIMENPITCTTHFDHRIPATLYTLEI